jgi:hypothetical protein
VVGGCVRESRSSRLRAASDRSPARHPPRSPHDCLNATSRFLDASTPQRERPSDSSAGRKPRDTRGLRGDPRAADSNGRSIAPKDGATEATEHDDARRHTGWKTRTTTRT